MTQPLEAAMLTEGLTRVFQVANNKITVLKDITLQSKKASFVVICGPSGSGKTTLLNIISGIDHPTKGKIFVLGEELNGKDEISYSNSDAVTYGLFFKRNLVSTLTVAENVAFPMQWLRESPQKIEKRVTELLKQVGLEHRANHFLSLHLTKFLVLSHSIHSFFRSCLLFRSATNHKSCKSLGY